MNFTATINTCCVGLFMVGLGLLSFYDPVLMCATTPSLSPVTQPGVSSNQQHHYYLFFVHAPVADPLCAP